jgi:hypothetical protein
MHHHQVCWSRSLSLRRMIRTTRRKRIIISSRIGDTTIISIDIQTKPSKGLNRPYVMMWVLRIATARTAIHMQNYLHRMPNSNMCPSRAMLPRQIGPTKNHTWRHTCCRLSAAEDAKRQPNKLPVSATRWRENIYLYIFSQRRWIMPLTLAPRPL